jgi:ABC-type Fe3+ transport system permease subunit
MRSRKISVLFFLFLFILLAPYLLALKEWQSFSVNEDSLGMIYLFSSLQSFSSTIFTLMLALPGALGLFWLHSKVPKSLAAVFEFTILLPSLLPGLFVVVSFLNLMPFFPFGLWGVVLLHGFSEAGLVAVILHRLLQYKLSPYLECAELMGCSRNRFLRSSFPLIAPQMLQIFFVLFLFFLSSISIPLILAGGHYTTLEAAIYQKIVNSHDWNQALNLFLLQAVFMGLGFAFIGRFQGAKTENVTAPASRFLAMPLGLSFLLIGVVVILLSLMIKIPTGLIALSNEPIILQGWRQYLAGSLLTGFLVGGASFVGLSALCYFYQAASLRKYFPLIMTPSLVILAFSFFLLPGTSPSAMYLKISCALGLGFLPTLMRFGFLQKLETLTDQAEAVALLGASSGKIFFQGLWPQALPQISLLSGLAAVWGMGDFAMSRIIAGSDVTLAMWVQSLVDQYRWDMALLLSWLILAASLVVFGFFWSLSYVSDKKLSESL